MNPRGNINTFGNPCGDIQNPWGTEGVAYL